MRDDQTPSPEPPPENSTDPVVRLEITEGTDIIVRPERIGETEVAAVPERVSSPDTEFVERGVASDTFVDEASMWGAASQGQSSPMTGRTPRQRRVRRWLFTGAIVVLVAVIVASLSEISELVRAEEKDHKTAERGDGLVPQESQSPPPAPRPVRETTELADLPRRGEEADVLLGLTVQAITDDNRRVDVALRSGPIAERRVTVVNLWATYCEPCKRELPGLKAMFEESGWGEEVRFVPVLDSDSRDSVWARDEFLPKMPATEHFLVDQEGRLRAALRRFIKGSKKEKKKDLALPITVVFDCQRDLRQLYPGALLEPDVVALRGQLEQLRNELSTGYCKPRRRKPATPATPVEAKSEPRPRCGDGRCVPPEESTNCCDCMTCPDTDICMQEGGAPRCIPTTGNLKL